MVFRYFNCLQSLSVYTFLLQKLFILLFIYLNIYWSSSLSPLLTFPFVRMVLYSSWLVGSLDLDHISIWFIMNGIFKGHFVTFRNSASPDPGLGDLTDLLSQGKSRGSTVDSPALPQPPPVGSAAASLSFSSCHISSEHKRSTWPSLMGAQWMLAAGEGWHSSNCFPRSRTVTRI